MNLAKKEAPQMGAHLGTLRSWQKAQLKAQRDQQTMTQHNNCACDCQTISKYKQKAHQSFMQVVEMENFYQEKIKNLKEQFETNYKQSAETFAERERAHEKRYKEYEREIQSLKGRPIQVGSARKILDTSFANPFTSESIDSITPDLLDDSTDFVEVLREFIVTSNLKDTHTQLKQKIDYLIRQTSQIVSKAISNEQASPDYLNNIQTNLNGIASEKEKIFEFISMLFEAAVEASQKYNRILPTVADLQQKCAFLTASRDSLQKQMSFMTEQLKKMSQEKLKIERKYNEYERANKNLEETLKLLKIEKSDKKRNRKLSEGGILIQICNDDDSDKETDGHIFINSSTRNHITPRNKELSGSNPLDSHKALFSKGLHFQKKKT